MNKKVLVIGSLNMDLVVTVSELPEKGETILGKNVTYCNGGKGANQACAAAKLGANVSMLGCVGYDEFGDILIDSLKKCNVDISKIKRTNQAKTGMAFINVSDSGDNNIVVVAGANNYCDIEYLKANDQEFINCDYVLLQLEIPLKSVEYAINRAKELDKVVILNPAPANKDLDDKLLMKVDYFTPNETELEALMKMKLMLKDKLISLRSIGIKEVIVTLGENGLAYLDNNNELVEIPAYNVKAVDTVGAGDCFNGALVVGLANGLPIAKALNFASAAAAIAVTRFGAQASLPSLSEVNEMLKEG